MSLALKIVLIVLAALAVVAILASCVVKYMENAAKHAKPKENLPFADKVELVSHRGLGCIAPENTASAFTKAGEYGFKYCECDIHQSSDGEFFVSHDATLNRMTDSEGEISEMTSQQILQAGINNGSNAKLYLGEKVPTLSRFLEICAKYGMRPVIEIKQKENFDVKKFCDLLKSKKLDESAVVIGYNVEYLRKVREFLPKTELQILCRNISEQVIHRHRHKQVFLVTNEIGKQRVCAIGHSARERMAFKSLYLQFAHLSVIHIISVGSAQKIVFHDVVKSALLAIDVYHESQILPHYLEVSWAIIRYRSTIGHLKREVVYRPRQHRGIHRSRCHCR